MIRINLLPHREMRRERRKKEFVGMAVVSAVVGAGLALMAAGFMTQQISAQVARNEFIKKKNAELDEKIAKIANLQSEIEALKARQTAVENLQSDRTLPVHLLDELVARVPEGVQLRSITQTDLKVTLGGIAQSNDRVSDLLNQLAYQTPWMEKPELVEIKALAPVATPGKDKDNSKRAYEFSVNVLLKRPNRKNDPMKVADASTVAPAAGAAQTTSTAAAPVKAQ